MSSSDERLKKARLAEVARRYARARGQGGGHRAGLAALRIGELLRLYRHHYGMHLPDDDAGRADFEILLHHVVQLPKNHTQRASQLSALIAPWMEPAELARTVDRIAGTPRRWTADALAAELNLFDDLRTQLAIRTIGAIDVPKAMRAQRRADRKRERDREVQRNKRLEKGPKRVPLTASQPWRHQGVSRATYYRHMRKAERNETK